MWLTAMVVVCVWSEGVGEGVVKGSLFRFLYIHIHASFNILQRCVRYVESLIGGAARRARLVYPSPTRSPGEDGEWKRGRFTSSFLKMKMRQ